MIVLDASAAVEWLLGFPAARAVHSRLGSPDESLHAPHLLPLEVAQVLRRYAAADEISDARAADALTDLADMDIALYSHAVLLPDVWRMRHNLTAYDAAYVALAEILHATLLTLDARLAAAPGVRTRIDLIS